MTERRRRVRSASYALGQARRAGGSFARLLAMFFLALAIGAFWLGGRAVDDPGDPHGEPFFKLAGVVLLIAFGVCVRVGGWFGRPRG